MYSKTFKLFREYVVEKSRNDKLCFQDREREREKNESEDEAEGGNKPNKNSKIH